MFETQTLSVDYSKNLDSQKIFSHSAVLSSHDNSWGDIFLEYHKQPGCDTGEWVAPLHQITIYMPDHPYHLERWDDRSYHNETINFGDIAIQPAGVTQRTRWCDEVKFLLLSIDPVWFQQIGLEALECEHLNLIPKTPPLKDPLIQGIALALKQVLERPSHTNSLYVNQLKNILGLHLLREYSDQTIGDFKCDGGLSSFHMQRVICYIKEHLEQDIKLADIAALTGVSSYYFCRLFRQSMGVSPYKYVIRQRIERAKQMLRQDRRRAIVEIALECGFSSQSHLTYHFNQTTGLTPNAYRKR